ncbi:MAG: YitT family protein [Atopobiaceae bacterium]|nr:YitT family protein [Atopobiaceae bacterium]
MASSRFRKSTLGDIVTIIVGSIIFALGLDCFEIPNGIAAGGISGLATIFAQIARGYGINLPIGMQVLAMNMLLMILVVREGGLRYAARTSLGIVVSSLATDLLVPFVPVLGNGDLILCALWGGVVCGFGLGLVFRAGGNTGGTDIIAQVVSRRTSIPMGVASLIADMAVVVLSVPVFGIEKALYATIAMYLGTRVLDMVLDGFNTQRAAYIISDQHERIKKHIFSDLDRGCTELLARGGYTGKERPVIFVVLTRPEMALLRRVVASVDPQATIVVSKIHEAFGNGFEQI